MAKKPIKVTEVVLRDAHQSLLATRMTMDEMRPILPEMDKINYFSVECWGAAFFSELPPEQAAPPRRPQQNTPRSPARSGERFHLAECVGTQCRALQETCSVPA